MSLIRRSFYVVHFTWLLNTEKKCLLVVLDPRERTLESHATMTTMTVNSSSSIVNNKSAAGLLIWNKKVWAIKYWQYLFCIGAGMAHTFTRRYWYCTFWAQKYRIVFSNIFFKNSNTVDEHGLESKFDKMCDEIIGKHLLPMPKTFVKEYVEVVAPIACGLDVLQGEMVAGLGYLLPTLCIIKSQLLELQTGQHLWVSLFVSLW